MSQYPSNFGPSTGGTPSGSPPYAGGPQQPAPKKGPNWLLIVGIVVGVLALGGAGLGVCCCGGGAAMFGTVFQMQANAVKVAVAENPVLQEHIGDISKIELNFEESAAASEGGPQRFAYDVTGSKGSGLLVVETNNDIENMEIYYGELTMPSGEVHDLEY